jgi:hypothetical protein
MARFFAVAALFLLVASCATAPSEPFSPAAPAPDGHANLYIYRHRAPPYIYRAEVYVDDRLVVKLPERGYSVFPVSRGAHTVRVESFDWPDVSFTLNVEDSDIFIRFTGGAENIGGGTLELAAEAYIVEEAAAAVEINACCRFISPQAEAQ